MDRHDAERSIAFTETGYPAGGLVTYTWTVTPDPQSSQYVELTTNASLVAAPPAMKAQFLTEA